MTRFYLITFISVLCCEALATSVPNDELWHQFVSPPDSARTKVWWFHGETETTKEGIDADLLSFKEKGVGGVVFYDQIHGDGAGSFPSMSPEWWEMLKYAAIKAKDCGLSFEVAAGNGYVTGGPWITPELAMKKTAYVEKFISCGQDTVVTLDLSHPNQEFKDVALLMFPDNDAYCPIVAIDEAITVASSDTTIDAGVKELKTVRGISYEISPKGKGSTASMNIPGSPSERYFGAKYVEYPPIGELECSYDSLTWTKVVSLMPVESPIGHKSNRRSISFPPAEGKYFRLHIHDWSGGDSNYKSFRLGKVTLHTRDIVDNAETLTGLRTEVTYPSAKGGDIGAINPCDIIVCGESVSSGGSVSVSIPKGSWRIIRFGYVPTGARTKHGRKNLLGYEADVMSAEAARTHYNNYFKPILDTLARIGVRPSGMCMDSHEAGIQNWTKRFESTFKDKNGYDITKWLPTFAGYIVDSREATGKVLSDFRKTVTATISSEYYGTLAALCREDSVDYTSQGMLNILTDNIAFRGNATKPQGEFWAYQTNGNYDCLDAASAAHLFGRNIASGEAFTDTPYSTPWDELLRIANIAYCRGINEFAICASSYQPWIDRKYDDSQSQHPYVFHRFHPNWDSSPFFWDYQARCANLLRKGSPVVDLLVYCGEEAPVKTFAYRLPVIPEGYNFDVCSYSILTDLLSASVGKIVSKGGMTYSALIVPDRTYLSAEAEDALSRLAAAGGVVIRCDRGEEVKDALAREGILPDIAFTNANRPDDRVMFFHRKYGDTDIYFIYNHSENPFDQKVELRTGNASAEIWNPYRGSREEANLPVCTSIPVMNGQTLPVNVSLPSYESRFIIVGK